MLSFRKNWKFWFLLPLIAYLLLFTMLPVLQSIWMSFHDKYTYALTLKNYLWLVTEFQFREAFINTISISVFALFFELMLALSIALFIAGGGRRRIIQALLLIPLGIPTIVVASNMRYLFDTNGFINQILNLHINWLGGGALTMFSVVISDMWKVTPLMMLILLAGLERIPKDILESASLDGADFKQKLRYIILPLLKPFITMALIIRGIDTFRIFELPLALAGDNFKVLASYAFFEYRNYNNPFTASAASTVLFLLIVSAMVIYVKVAGLREEKKN